MFRSLLASTVLAVGFLAAPAVHAAEETAIFAGGCFWCVESDMDHVKGVISTTSGYAGGEMKNPSYENHEGYTEAVKVVFDNSVTRLRRPDQPPCGRCHLRCVPPE